MPTVHWVTPKLSEQFLRLLGPLICHLCSYFIIMYQHVQMRGIGRKSNIYISSHKFSNNLGPKIINQPIITSFSCTTILYSSAHKRISEYTNFLLQLSTHIPFNMASLLANMAIDVDNNFFRGRSNSSSKVSSRSVLVTSIASSVSYHQRCYEYSDTNNFLFFYFILFYFF